MHELLRQHQHTSTGGKACALAVEWRAAAAVEQTVLTLG